MIYLSYGNGFIRLLALGGVAGCTSANGAVVVAASAAVKGTDHYGWFEPSASGCGHTSAQLDGFLVFFFFLSSDDLVVFIFIIHVSNRSVSNRGPHFIILFFILRLVLHRLIHDLVIIVEGIVDVFLFFVWLERLII
jgi:hypothetical protein